MRINVNGANRTTVHLSNGTELFISYSTCVACRLPDGSKYRTEKQWSRTTSKMIGEWGMRGAPTKDQSFFDDLMSGV